MTAFDSFLREVERALYQEPARARQIVTELRALLQRRAVEAAKAHPDLSPREIEQRIIADMGDPQGLAYAYTHDGPRPTVAVPTPAGRAVRAAGRGVKKTLKWTAVTLIALVAVSVIVGAWAFHEARPYLHEMWEQGHTTQLYHHSHACHPDPCTALEPVGRFTVPAAADDLRVSLWIGHVETNDGAGNVRVSIVDPGGLVLYQRNHSLAPAGHVRESFTVAAVPGLWEVQLAFENFRGTFGFDVEATGTLEV